MSQIPDAWSNDPWTAPPPTTSSSTLSARSTPFSPSSSSSTPSTVSQPSAPPTKKQSKLLKRQEQAEFNRQLWADAETPQNETNYFLSTRNVVPLKQEFKKPTVMLRRGGMPVVQRRVKKEEEEEKESVEGVGDGVRRMGLNGGENGRQEESSEDEDEVKERERLEVERRERRKVEREEKQKKYEERRHELFGSVGKGGGSAGSSPGVTPPGSRSATPNRGRGGRGRGSRGGGGILQGQRNGLSVAKERAQDLFDPMSVSKTQGERRGSPRRDESVVQPVRMPKGPDGSGRGGFGFGARGGRQAVEFTT